MAVPYNRYYTEKWARGPVYSRIATAVGTVRDGRLCLATIYSGEAFAGGVVEAARHKKSGGASERACALAREEECQTIRMFSFDPNWKYLQTEY